MFFPEHYRKIYKHPDAGEFDPLEVERKLVIESGNKVGSLITVRNATVDNRGDVSEEGRRTAAVEAAGAELELGRVSRKVFNLPPETLLVVALEVLYDFLGWIEGKGERAGTPVNSVDSTDWPQAQPMKNMCVST